MSEDARSSSLSAMNDRYLVPPIDPISSSSSQPASPTGLPVPKRHRKDAGTDHHGVSPSEGAMATGYDGVHDSDHTAQDSPDRHAAANNASNVTTASPSSSSCPAPDVLATQPAINISTRTPSALARVQKTVITFGKFIGPGFMIAVAYIDPGNYSTDIAAGASYRFRLLFVVLLSNLFAILLQGLSLKLGSVTGLDLAEACRAFLPRWLNFFLYILAEVAIIATDLAEVIGTAIAINLLIPQVPLVAGCAISILDVMIILLFYNPNGSMKGLRSFEYFVVALVLAVVVCFCIQMSLIQSTSVGEVFRGYLPSSVIIEQQALYQACGILGATVMPHSLYLGSGTVQPRLKEYDKKMGLLAAEHLNKEKDQSGVIKTIYVPSLAAIKHCIKYSMTELVLSLFTFALFINSSILIVAGASLYGSEEAQNDDIFAIHKLLTQNLGKGAGVLFALALLLSGISAGIVCTIAGQMVSEGALAWRMPPWARRLVTRSISITPSIIIAGGVGREGLDTALNASQVVLSAVLPFVSAPLIYFTCLNKYMKVPSGEAQIAPAGEEDDDEEGGRGGLGQNASGMMVTASAGQDNAQHGGVEYVHMRNSIPVAILAVLVWMIITAMNVANLVLLGLGKG